MTAETCAACRGTRYCAPLRCYCGHDACPAFSSYIDMSLVPLADRPSAPTGTRQSESWANRGEATWIDQL